MPTATRVMEEVFDAAPGEGFVGWLFPKSVEEVSCLTMGKDVEEAQENFIRGLTGTNQVQNLCAH